MDAVHDADAGSAKRPCTSAGRCAVGGSLKHAPWECHLDMRTEQDDLHAHVHACKESTQLRSTPSTQHHNWMAILMIGSMCSQMHAGCDSVAHAAGAASAGDAPPRLPLFPRGFAPALPSRRSTSSRRSSIMFCSCFAHSRRMRPLSPGGGACLGRMACCSVTSESVCCWEKPHFCCSAPNGLGMKRWRGCEVWPCIVPMLRSVALLNSWMCHVPSNVFINPLSLALQKRILRFSSSSHTFSRVSNVTLTNRNLTNAR
mmetsp:Transcript_10269/g.30941  ORF Transcript_10269/g.30941 Transcript_10269/m.30941 type:complete len:258 (-) Transcript_10269:516-1289(-)